MDLSFTNDALRILWSDTVTVYSYTGTKDTVTGLTDLTPAPIVTNEPCRISFGTASNADAAKDGWTAELTQEVKLFVRPDLVIPEGSFIDVTRNNITTRYRNSSVPKIFASHREYTLDIEDRRA